MLLAGLLGAALPTAARAVQQNSIAKIVAETDAAEKTKQAEAMFQDAMTAKALRHYEQAVDKFQRVIDYDAANDTGLASQAQIQIATIKNQLVQQAAPYRAEGRAAAARGDFLSARAAYRQAITIDPYDQTLVLELQPIQEECEKGTATRVRELRKKARELDIRRLPDGSQICPWP